MRLDTLENDDVPEQEPADEVIILEEINTGETGAVVAIPTQDRPQNEKKREQPPITNFFVKKQTNKK